MWPPQTAATRNAPAYSVKIGVIFGVWFQRRTVDKEANLHEN